jgi:hypothetical protein
VCVCVCVCEKAVLWIAYFIQKFAATFKKDE